MNISFNKNSTEVQDIHIIEDNELLNDWVSVLGSFTSMIFNWEKHGYISQYIPENKGNLVGGYWKIIINTDVYKKELPDEVNDFIKRHERQDKLKDILK